MASGRRVLNEETMSAGTTDLEGGEKGATSDRVYMIEMEEWTRVNRQLRQRGLPSVEVLHPKKAAESSDVVVFEPETARTMRHTLQTLMKDCDRRQELVQDLILTNNQLRDGPGQCDVNRTELGEQTLVTEKYESKTRDLKMLLDSSRDKIDELEEDKLTSSGHYSMEEDRLRNTKNTIQIRCRQLQKQCDEQRAEIDRLTHQLEQITKQNEKRLLRQQGVFQQFWKRGSRSSSAMDDKVLDIIDSYERQIYSLRKQLESDTDSEKEGFEEATPNYRALVKSYEKEVRDARKRIKAVENDNELLRLDLQSRPELKDFRATQHRLKKLEKIFKQHKISVTDGKQVSSVLPHSSHVEDLDFMPATQCQQYLRHVCEELSVEDVEEVVPLLQQQARAINTNPKLQEFAREVLTIVNAPGVPIPPEFRSRPPVRRAHEVWCEKSWHHVLPTVQYWQNQLHDLKDLQEVVNKLTSTLIPGKVAPLEDGDPTVKILAALHAVLSDSEGSTRVGSPGKKEKPARSVLQGIVDHFMTLFDVQKISGVYARMSDLYTKLGEVNNILRTLRSLLCLPADATAAVVVDTVAHLCQSQSQITEEQLKLLLGIDNLDTLNRKLEEHDEFFPVFQEIMTKLMDICDVQRIDQVIPTVRALKLLAG